MELRANVKAVQKNSSIGSLANPHESAIAKYQKFFVGRDGLWSLIRFELFTTLCGSRSGALGYLMRKHLYSRLLHEAGSGIQWGRNVCLRHPAKMVIGECVMIDENCLLDARGVGVGQLRIGNHVLIARNVAIQSKTDCGCIEIGDHCSIGNNSTLSSAGGIRLGSHVMLAGHCYIGGGRYHFDRSDIPMMQQPMYSKGVVEIGDDCWLGAGSRVLDGATIGSGSVIGAGALVIGTIPPRSIAIGVPARVVGTREDTTLGQDANVDGKLAQAK